MYCTLNYYSSRIVKCFSELGKRLSTSCAKMKMAKLSVNVGSPTWWADNVREKSQLLVGVQSLLFIWF